MNTERRSRNRKSFERNSRARGFPLSVGGLPFPVPEGHRRRLAGGKSAPADAAPGNRPEWFRAPAGHRRNSAGCGPIAGNPICPRRRVMAAMLREGRPQKLLRCPAGACPVRRGNRGPRPLARACPRLISCGVPPGRSDNRRRQFSGDLIVAGATASSSRPAKTLKSCSAETNNRLQPLECCHHSTNQHRVSQSLSSLCSSCLCGEKSPPCFLVMATTISYLLLP